MTYSQYAHFRQKANRVINIYIDTYTHSKTKNKLKERKEYIVTN